MSIIAKRVVDRLFADLESSAFKVRSVLGTVDFNEVIRPAWEKIVDEEIERFHEQASSTPMTARLVDELFPEANRTRAIAERRCVDSPIGCGRPVGEFRDPLSACEYQISGLCQECLDSICASDELDGAPV